MLLQPEAPAHKPPVIHATCFAAARYYRLAEKAGNKTMGNSWIWKDKYDPEQQRQGRKKK
ncbi:hypothetical protein E4U54_006405 [Claviceps lovelessii]|nr:hypothetical protein E4U54_006405 [Claviceps lovelessii]